MHALLLVALVSLLALTGCSYVPMYGTQGIHSEGPDSTNPQRTLANGENRSRPQIVLKKGPGFVDPKIQPYSVMGKTYWPVQSAMGFREDGLASWYGIDFHGRNV
jgi:rare lipoprotein A